MQLVINKDSMRLELIIIRKIGKFLGTKFVERRYIVRHLGTRKLAADQLNKFIDKYMHSQNSVKKLLIQSRWFYWSNLSFRYFCKQSISYNQHLMAFWQQRSKKISVLVSNGSNLFDFEKKTFDFCYKKEKFFFRKRIFLFLRRLSVLRT